MPWLFIGIATGVLITVPCAWLFGRRTERRVRELERQARASERLAEQATMTSGLAHEIKNPLSTIGLNVQLLQEDLADIAGGVEPEGAVGQQVGRVRRRLAGLRREADRLREILEDFLRFAGRLELDLAPTEINQLVDELAAFFEPQAAERQINLRVQCRASPDRAQADASLLKQALLNLLINAVHAMADAQESNQPHGGATELILRTTREEGRLLIHVTDTGPGMSDDVATRVFEPYFSTKRTGTGLGLPTARRIIEQHGGTLTAHSEPGRGTDFIITLPV